MFGKKPFYYIVDKLDAAKAEMIRKGLASIPGVNSVKVSVSRGMVEVASKRDLESQVRVACDVAGALFRTRYVP